MNDDGSRPFPIIAKERALQFNQAPINKVGLVLLRDLHGDDPQVCLTQVKAKDPAEQHLVNFGLPKGTRQYLDPQTHKYKDARDFMEAVQFKDQLEPLSATVMREAEEEIGLSKHAFARAAVYDLGGRLFASRDSSPNFQSPYDIQWYVIQANAPLVESMDPRPKDAHAVRWFTLSQVRAMKENKTINPCYVDVIEDAVKQMRSRKLSTLQSWPEQPTR